MLRSLLLVLVLSTSLLAQPASDTAEAEAEKLQKLVEESVSWYEFLPDENAKKAMEPVVVLRWRNVPRGQTAEDLMALWIHAGRPQAVASIYPWKGLLCHEVATLSRQKTLVARDGGNVIWAPSQAGGPYVDLPESPEPAESEPARLRQMKAIAQRFTVTMTGWKPDDSDREELRLLPRPLYRYAMKDAKTVHPDLLDGAVFGYVQGTDPEAVLIVEAVKAGESYDWQYAFARATSGGLEARLEEKVVWTAEKGGGRAGIQKPQTVLQRVIPE